MSRADVELGDVAAWVLQFDSGDPALLALAIGDLSLAEAQQAVTQLVALTSLALAGTGGREPDAWLAALIADQRRTPDLDSPP